MALSPSARTPPRPRLAIRVGVTGHRPSRLNEADGPVLRRRVEEVLALVQRAAHQVATDAPGAYADAPPLLRVVSALAEGADRIVAQVALASGFELQVALPYPDANYRQEFAGRESVAEFELLYERATATLVLDGTPQSPAAYEAVGRTIVRQSDMLIAIWDGEEAAGRGGTAEVVRMALASDMPIVRIDSRPPHEATLVRRVTAVAAETKLEQLSAELAVLLRPPAVRRGRRADLRNDYFAETRVRGGVFDQAYGVVTNLLTRPRRAWPSPLPKDYEAATKAAWRAQWLAASVSLPESLTGQLEARLLKPYAWGDHLAIYYANCYRSAFSWIYLMAPVAVLAALLAYFSGAHGTDAERSWAAVEVSVLVAILGIYGLGKYRLWHERWLDYRSLAERVRHLTYLLPLGRTSPVLRVPMHLATTNPRATWVDWYVHAVVREAGLFTATIDATYLAACRALLKDTEIGNEQVGQIQYHTANAARMHAIHSRLQGLAVLMFAAALAACVGHFNTAFWERHRELLTYLAVLLPVLGGSVHGFLSQGDFQDIGRRSAAVRAGLVALASRLEHVGVPATPAPGALAEAIEELGDLAEETAEVMDAELIDWRVGVEGKPLTLPA